MTRRSDPRFSVARERERRSAYGVSDRRGFTLVELLVAMTAGVLVAMAAFLLARNATKFFQLESRISAAQFANMIGLNRLKTDLTRAGFLASPNVDDDPLICGKNNWPAGLSELAAIRIEQNGSKVRHPSDHALTTLNNLTPDALIIGGTMGTTEYFAIQAVAPGVGGGHQIWLQNDAAMNRLVSAAPNRTQALSQIFKAGRFLRVIDHEGRHAYGVITGVSDTAGNASVSLAASPALPLRSASNSICGCDALCVGGMVSPVARILYDIRVVSPSSYPRYKHLFETAPTAPGSQHKGVAPIVRTELVRVELDQTDTEIADSLEVVSEYAVDLKFGVTTASIPTGPHVPPVITRHPIGGGQTYTIANRLQSNGDPQRIRSVQVRFSTRAARKDRDVGLTPPNNLVGIYRYNLGTNRGFARVRTLLADVDIPNLAAVNW